MPTCLTYFSSIYNVQPFPINSKEPILILVKAVSFQITGETETPSGLFLLLLQSA